MSDKALKPTKKGKKIRTLKGLQEIDLIGLTEGIEIPKIEMSLPVLMLEPPTITIKISCQKRR